MKLISQDKIIKTLWGISEKAYWAITKGPGKLDPTGHIPSKLSHELILLLVQLRPQLTSCEKITVNYALFG